MNPRVKVELNEGRTKWEQEHPIDFMFLVGDRYQRISMSITEASAICDSLKQVTEGRRSMEVEQRSETKRFRQKAIKVEVTPDVIVEQLGYTEEEAQDFLRRYGSGIQATLMDAVDECLAELDRHYQR